MQQTDRNTEILSHFRHGGAAGGQEAAVLDAAIREIVARGGRITTKAIILHLIAEMETTSDTVKLDVIRNVLEIVVGRTSEGE